MDAQLHGYFVGDLSFQAHGDYSTSTNEIRYSFGAYFIYNLGYTATAQILGLFDWALGPRVAYPSNKSIELYFKEGSIPLSADASTKSQAIGERSFPSRALDETPGETSDEDYPGNGTSLWLSPVSGLHPRADDDQSGRSPQFSQPLTCPAGSSGDVRVPELRCKFLLPCTLLSSFTAL
jgi:chitinase